MKTREQIDLELIDDNPWQPRVAMDPEGVEEMADSIAALGLLQAPLARRDTIRDRYQLAFGHRRVAACRLLHLGGAGPEVRVHVALDLLRRLRDVELVDDLNGGPAPATVER